MRVYLSCHQQYVSVGQSRSSVLPVLSGIPQGSIFGPLLFLIFINDLPSALSSSLVLLFADNAKCFMSVSSQSDCLLLQNDLSRLVEWSSTWSLFLNEDKCCTVHFTKISLPYHLVILSMTSRFHPNLLKGTLAFLYHQIFSGLVTIKSLLPRPTKP